ncbi:hypothetical protein BDY17DRAFT_321619 [Neohortaea acidophila]|uniref:RRM domain-containing protein n=1 Tax=Neohortaea acidophila TaxID=245834 RepID=A0A6A6Q380_9PEZI|nr:uncharacterized protein BDY17DRAFT_321619 [Neohortaea acidophila]KAF2486860.1 hypothetical protein BDY17DRAFT_321619 [Neohortaea acidophila]
MAPARKKVKLVDGAVPVVEPAVKDTAVTEEASPANSQKDGPEHRRSLFVRSLPATTTTQSLTDLFSDSYPIKHAIAVTDPATKQCRGYGFVTFADAEDAQRAKEEFNGHALEGKKLRIELAEPRQRDGEGDTAAEAGNKRKRTFGKQQQGEEATPPQASRLIVRNLPWTIKTPEHLSKLFMSYGKIKQAYIPTNKQGQMSGFGFVVLRGRKNAEKALEGINGKEVDGRTLAVDWAVSKDVYENALQRGAEGGEEVSKEDGGAEESSDADDGKLGVVDGEDLDDSMEPGSDEDEADEDDVDVEMDDGTDDEAEKKSDTSTTLFVRNLPFTCTDEDLEDAFAKFGKTRYARVVMDFETERSRGTGFVCFYSKEDADACVRNAPRPNPQAQSESKDVKTKQAPNSVLQNEANDPSGEYSIDGRVLQVSRAVEKSEANRLTQEGVAQRRKRNEDKRRLYLLPEGTISTKSKLWEKLTPTERNMRDASAKQRKTLIESNPSLHLSLTRLSVRNVPRSITSKDLKSLAREAVVGFATDVKAGLRQKLSKEELIRGGEEMDAAEKARKKSGKGVVKQAKVVFEGASGTKVTESSGAGRSRGYGFIEFYTHRCALMGLRWLNGHAIGYQVKEEKKKSKLSQDEIQDRKKRLIVEFAIENAQVVLRRKDREQKARDRSLAVDPSAGVAEADNSGELEHSVRRELPVGSQGLEHSGRRGLRGGSQGLEHSGRRGLRGGSQGLDRSGRRGLRVGILILGLEHSVQRELCVGSPGLEHSGQGLEHSVRREARVGEKDVGTMQDRLGLLPAAQMLHLAQRRSNPWTRRLRIATASLGGNEPCVELYEVIHFHCGHAGRRLIKHCHFARNDPEHMCSGSWSIKREWISANQVCAECAHQNWLRRVQMQQQQQVYQQRQMA